MTDRLQFLTLNRERTCTVKLSSSDSDVVVGAAIEDVFWHADFPAGPERVRGGRV